MSQLAACAICGAPVRPPFRAPPAELAPDLDLRPGEPTRSTLPNWIATCRRCGASAPNLSVMPDGAGDLVRSAGYKTLRVPGPAMPALRWAYLCEHLGRRAEAAEATLQAAWALDDAGQDAAEVRRRAVALWGEPEGTEDTLRLIDMLRRAGDLGAAEARAATLDGAAQDENTAAILAFQRARIAEGDTGRHMISSALRPPARRPHVMHGQDRTHGQGRTRGQAGASVWGRLFGR